MSASSAGAGEILPVVDAHHHLWQLSGGPLYYPWLQDPQPHDFFLGDYALLKRDYLPPDYRHDAAGHDDEPELFPISPGAGRAA